MQRILVLAEGQTEERFVKDTLQPYLWTQNVHLEPKIATTKRVKQGPHFKGGITGFQRVENDLRRLLADAGAVLVTTLFDYYGLPDDFPGRASSRARSGVEGARIIEEALEQHFATTRFKAYLSVHEFEGLLYTDPLIVAELMDNADKGLQMFAERCAFATPEDVNDGKTTHPSKRILRLFPAYQKVLHGPLASGRIGLVRLRSECPHFNEWVTMLEQYGTH